MECYFGNYCYSINLSLLFLDIMEEPNKLPIEDDRELLTEYGRAFAWINSIELILEQLIVFKGNFHLIDKDLREKLIEKKMLGQKIELATTLLEPELIKELRLLNSKRTFLAHNAIVQEIHFSSDGEQKIGNYVVGTGEKREILTIDFLLDIIKLAQSLSTKLHNAFLKAISKN
jgi:hypothetical protein